MKNLITIRRERVFHHPNLRGLYLGLKRRKDRISQITCTYKVEVEMAHRCKIKINTTVMKMVKKIQRLQVMDNSKTTAMKKMISKCRTMMNNNSWTNMAM